MEARGQDWKKQAFKAAVYLASFLCACLVAWAFLRAYRSFNIVRRYREIVVLLGVAYYAVTLVYTYRKSGIRRFWSHIVLLQILPFLTFAFVSCVVTRVDNRWIRGGGEKNRYEREFNDLQAAQYDAALENGLEPFASRAELNSRIDQLKRSDRLVKIESNSRYTVSSLSYSVPYVVPKVERLLDDLAKAFRENSDSKVKFVVTSVLRTNEDVERLRRVNGNASANSCHCYATTIDISYARFDGNAQKHKYRDMRIALSKALSELRKQGRCYVKFEAKQRCYHITVR